MHTFHKELEQIKDIEVKRDIPLRDFTTFRIGGRAGLFILPKSHEGLRCVVSFLNSYGKQYHILGGGSNLLVNDRDFDIVISLKALNYIADVQTKDNGELLATFYAGLSLKKTLSWLLQRGFSGFEDLTGIPGSIGGAIKMNAGVKEFSIADNLTGVLILQDDTINWVERDKINFSYRSSGLPDGCIIIAGRFIFTKKEKKEILNKIMYKIQMRNRTQPISKASAGCIFKNPVDAAAGKLIEICGLKGKTIGNAMVSIKHANFIINKGKASFNDVVGLIDHVKESVYKKTGYVLQNEVKIWY
jgi:UDP-N-acetylmuramate dehydrogenase